MKLGIKYHFDASHQLPNYDGACANLHGHRWNVELTIEGEVNKETGMVIDFKKVKEVINSYDHAHLNLCCSNPTAENLVMQIKERIESFGIKCLVRLYESPDCWVEA
jgi:6-pyruvoyltetrahydropterin/6-carboxytetrahydropterin synthase